MPILETWQHKMIYHPRPYRPQEYPHFVRAEFQEIVYDTSQGKQVAFYKPSLARGVPKFLWIFFHGNASLALDWAPFIDQIKEPETGFLLIDYPGYGRSEGKASPETILETSELALRETLAALKIKDPPPLGVFGFSLGGASGLQFSVRHPVKKIVLISIFTSMKELAVYWVGDWMASFLHHDFDNRKHLQELLSKDPAPEIYMFHGAKDETVPVEMSRELRELDPKKIKYRELPESSHNSIIIDAYAEILNTLTVSRQPLKGF